MSPRTTAARPRRPLHPGAALLLALTTLGSCGGDESVASTGEPEAAASRQVRKDVLDLIAAVTPFPSTLPVGDQHRWYARRRDILERLRGAGHAHGLEALRLYHERADSLVPIRRGLLDVAAHNAPEETRDELVTLVQEFGEDLGLRSEAAELLGDALPETAVEVLEPILRGERPGRTYPEWDIMLHSWHRATLALGRDPVPTLCEIAIDLNRDYAVRHAATKLLGERPSNQGRQALERILIESGGNQLIRRYAAQSLRDTVPAEDFCEILQRTFEREQDLAFQRYLEDMTVRNCP